MMGLPIVAPAPVVSDHTAVFRYMFDNQCPFRQFQHYLTGLIVRPNRHQLVCQWSGALPLGLGLYRRYEELPQWDAAVTKHCPTLQIRTNTKARNRLHQQVDPVWSEDPDFRKRHEPFQTNIALEKELVEEAIRHKVAFGVVVLDAW